MSESKSQNNTNNIYPEKPKRVSGFKKAVAWFGGRELLASLKGTIIYAIYGENIDPRSWMNANVYPGVFEKIKNKEELKVQKDFDEEHSEDSNKAEQYLVSQTEIPAETEDDKTHSEIEDAVKEDWAKQIEAQWDWKRKRYKIWKQILENNNFKKNFKADDQKLEEIWFDYIADSGDGQLGVYNVACLCFSDIWIDKIDHDKNLFESTKDAKIFPIDIDKYNEYKNSEAKESLDIRVENAVKEKALLPRGSFLFVGGDTAYHLSNYQTLFERFQTPFRWAFTSVREFTAEFYQLKKEYKKDSVSGLEGTIPEQIEGKDYVDTEPLRPLFGIPANHDYYDAIDGFNRQFRKPPFKNVPENLDFKAEDGKILLHIPTFTREQEASYIAINLPFNWWFFGIDSENEKLDFRQKLYFQNLVKNYKPKKLILATPEPTTVFGQRPKPEDKTSIYLEKITEVMDDEDEQIWSAQPFTENVRVLSTDNGQKNYAESTEHCRLDLSGDVHHYARYWGQNTKKFVLPDNNKKTKLSFENYASVVSGGGGAFFDVTGTLHGKVDGIKSKRENLNEKEKELRGDIPPQNVYPSEKDSVEATADRIFDLWNLRKGGYIHLIGALIAVLIFYFITNISNASDIESLSVFSSYISDISNKYLFEAATFTFIAILFGIATYNISGLVQDLKDRSKNKQLRMNIDGGIGQIFKYYTVVLAALFVYSVAYSNFTFYSVENEQAIFKFVRSYIFLLHIVMSGLLVWLSVEHTNWLALRFKIFRHFKIPTYNQHVEDPNNENNFRIINWLARNTSYKYLIPNLLIILAMVFLVLGINSEKNAEIAKTLADIILIITVVALFSVVVKVLAISIGTSYNSKLKKMFIPLGIWHFVLQVATPFVLVFYGTWWFLIINFLLVLLFNGSAILTYFAEKFKYKNIENHSLKHIRGGAYLTKLISKLHSNVSGWVLFLIWIIYGSIILFVPLFFNEATTTIYKTIKNPAEGGWIETIYQISNSFIAKFVNIPPDIFDIYFTVVLSLIVVGYVGYVMSRVWLSWYLAVSMLANGHNNEVGGAARIEGYKHILRVRVREDNLTVFVLGFEETNSDFTKLDVKLVDKFTLSCVNEKNS